MHSFFDLGKIYLNFDWRFEAECCDEKGRWMRRSPQMAHGPIDGVLHDPYVYYYAYIIICQIWTGWITKTTECGHSGKNRPSAKF